MQKTSFSVFLVEPSIGVFALILVVSESVFLPSGIFRDFNEFDKSLKLQAVHLRKFINSFDAYVQIVIKQVPKLAKRDINIFTQKRLNWL